MTTMLEAPPVPAAATAVAPPIDDLFQLELRVARRADELAAGGGSSRARDLLLWFQAEREVLGAQSRSDVRG